jgi:NAD(P)-dependent dehydrogenase (short-subunit alcohol dehydrogenase family)
MHWLDMFSLKDKKAVITGGERGIGLEIAMGFAEAGADILIAGLADEEFKNAEEKIRAIGAQCHCIRTDVSQEDSVKAMVSRIQEFFGRVDILVNNAGINKPVPAEEMPLEVWKRIIDINLTGTFLVSREVGAIMIAQGSGNIVNIASMSGLVVNPLPQQQCAYNCSKAGVIMLTKCMANEWAQKGVRVNAIAPGFIRTPMTRKRLDTPHDPIVKKWINGTPMNRIGTPKELVGAALYLASDASTFTTGTVLTVDGGYTCL